MRRRGVLKEVGGPGFDGDRLACTLEPQCDLQLDGHRGTNIHILRSDLEAFFADAEMVGVPWNVQEEELTVRIRLGGLTVPADRVMYLHNSVGNDAACLVDDGAANAAGRAELREGGTGGSHQKNKKQDNGSKIFTRSHHRSSQSTYLCEWKKSSRSSKSCEGV